jgi:hypothetical protein
MQQVFILHRLCALAGNCCTCTLFVIAVPSCHRVSWVWRLWLPALSLSHSAQIFPPFLPVLRISSAGTRGGEPGGAARPLSLF